MLWFPSSNVVSLTANQNYFPYIIIWIDLRIIKQAGSEQYLNLFLINQPTNTDQQLGASKIFDLARTCLPSIIKSCKQIFIWHISIFPVRIRDQAVRHFTFFQTVIILPTSSKLHFLKHTFSADFTTLPLLSLFPFLPLRKNIFSLHIIINPQRETQILKFWLGLVSFQHDLTSYHKANFWRLLFQSHFNFTLFALVNLILSSNSEIALDLYMRNRILGQNFLYEEKTLH